jgi:hypothetical protein
MTFKITNADYKNILTYYNLDIPKNNKDIKRQAEDVLALKLCSCIKKIAPLSPENEARSIGICSKSVFKNKGLTRGKFKCRNGRSVSFKKTRKVMSIGKKKTLKRNI